MTACEQNWSDPNSLLVIMYDAFVAVTHALTLIGCSVTRTVSARSVLDTCIPMQPFTLKRELELRHAPRVNAPLRLLWCPGRRVKNVQRSRSRRRNGCNSTSSNCETTPLLATEYLMETNRRVIPKRTRMDLCHRKTHKYLCNVNIIVNRLSGVSEWVSEWVRGFV